MSVDPPARSPRRYLKWSAVVVAIVAVGVAVNRWFARNSIPAIEPFNVQQFESISVKPERNAIPVFRKAAAGFVDQAAFMAAATPARQNAFPASYNAAIKDWPLASADIRAWLEANRPAMEIWKQGSRLDEALDVPPEKMTIVTDSSLWTDAARTFTRLALLEAARLTSQGHVVAAWEWYRAVLRTSRLIGMHASLIPRLIGVASQSMATEAVIPWSARPELTAADLRGALNDVLLIDAMSPPTSDCLKIEYFVASNSFGWFESQLGPGTAFFAFGGGRDRAQRSLNLIFANWLSQADRPRFQRAPIHHGEIDLFDVDPSQAVGGLSAAEIERRGLSGFFPNPLLALMVPAGFAGIEAIDREHARRAGLILVLALELSAREHAELPNDLEALVKQGYLKSIPADPFGKGEPMHYRRAEKPADGGLVWSVWTDGVDQEGKVCVSENQASTDGDKCFEVRMPPIGKRAAPSKDQKK